MKDEFLFKVKWCQICNQGWIEIVKEKGTDQLFLCCSECETEWVDPENIDNNFGTQDNFGATERPTLAVIKSKNWDKYLIVD